MPHFRLSAALVLTLAAPALAAPTADAPQPADQAAAAFQLPEKFSADLIAAEPDLVQPVALAIDDRGSLWVAEAHAYPKHGDQAGSDRILVFSDRDGDGRFEERKVFFDRLNYVTGLELGFGGAWVMSPPYFYFIPDADGDGVPDGEARVILDGFGNHANAHNLANNFAWGPDGWLYGTHGRTNWSLPGKPGTPKDQRTRFDGGVWRYHPVRDHWEPWVDGCTNPWGIDWNELGEAFIPNTVDPHLFHAVYGMHYGPHRNRKSSQHAYARIQTIADHLHYPGGNIRKGLGTEAVNAFGGGHSHCGMLIYQGGQWPERYRGGVFLHNTHGRRINHDVLARRGSGYTASHAPDFMISQDPWFMGVNFRTGPDGSVYVTDWSDTGECHSTRNTRKHTGRLYRIRYGDLKPRRVDLTRQSDTELAALQGHDNAWFARHARRILHERAAAGANLAAAQERLRLLFAEGPTVPLKLRALWALHLSGGADEPFLLRQLDHPNESIRSWAVRLLCEDRDPPRKALVRFERMARTGDSPFVRLHLASVLQRLPHEVRWPIAEALLGRAEDLEDQNLPLMYWYAIEPLVLEDAERFAALIPVTKSPRIQEFIARRLASAPDSDR